MLSKMVRVTVRVISQSNKSAGYESEVYSCTPSQVRRNDAVEMKNAGSWRENKTVEMKDDSLK